MVEENTASTDTERVDYLTPRGLTRVGIKVGFGLLLSLFAIASLFSFLIAANSNTVVVVLLLIALACGTIAAVAITTAITGPVGKLVSASEAIAEGDLSQRVDIPTKDEFGILGEAFNEMVAQLQRAQENLEARVQDRTAALEVSNGELEASNENLIAESKERQRLEEVERLRSQELAMA